MDLLLLVLSLLILTEFLQNLIINIKIKTPTPPLSSSSNQSFYLGKTPANLYQLNQQKRQLQDLQQQQQSLSSIVAEQALEKVIKGAELVMQNSVLLQQEIHQLQASNKHQKEKKKNIRAFIQDGV